jgi:hypothetical protein
MANREPLLGVIVSLTEVGVARPPQETHERRKRALLVRIAIGGLDVAISQFLRAR